MCKHTKSQREPRFLEAEVVIVGETKVFKRGNGGQNFPKKTGSLLVSMVPPLTSMKTFHSTKRTFSAKRFF